MQRQTLDLNSLQMAHMSYSPNAQQQGHSSNSHVKRERHNFEMDPSEWEATATEGLSQLASKIPMQHHQMTNPQNGMVGHLPMQLSLPQGYSSMLHQGVNSINPYQGYHHMMQHPIPQQQNAMSQHQYPPQPQQPQSQQQQQQQQHSHRSPQNQQTGSPQSPLNRSSNQNEFEYVDSSGAPQKVRTERYIKVIVRGVAQVTNKPLFLSWFLDNNGLPDACMLLIPERHPNCIINFKGINGWIEIDTKNISAPDHAIEFELKLQHSFLNRKNNLQNQPIGLRFFLLDKQMDGSITCLGEVVLNVILMSAKCSTKALITKLTKSVDSFQPKMY